MKTTKKQADDHYLHSTTLERLQHEARGRILQQELEDSWRLEALDRIITLLQLDPPTFHRLWIRPLLEAGVSLDTAMQFIAESWFHPN